MQVDPDAKIKNLTTIAQLLAEVLNDFFENLSYKTIGFLIVLIVTAFFTSNCFMKKQSSKLKIKNE
jgi:hypothetical protein